MEEERRHQQAALEAEARRLEEKRRQEEFAELREQVERWRFAKDLREFAAAATQLAEGKPLEDASSWIARVRTWADEIDPLEFDARLRKRLFASQGDGERAEGRESIEVAIRNPG